MKENLKSVKVVGQRVQGHTSNVNTQDMDDVVKSLKATVEDEVK